MKFPLFRYVIALIIGISFYSFSSFSLNSYYPSIFGILLMLYVIFQFVKFKDSKVWQGIIAVTILMLFGHFNAFVHDDLNDTQHFIHYDSLNIVAIEGVIDGIPKETSKTYKYQVSINSIYLQDTIISPRGKLLLYLFKSDKQNDLQRGDRILIKSRAIKLKASGIPYAFDYSKYMSRKGIYHQIFAKRDQILIVGHEGLGGLKSLAEMLRAYSIGTINKYISNEEHRSVALALLIGEKSSLDVDLKKSFTNAGAIHVLAVSGLHVGIIYQILLMVLSFLKKRRFGNSLIFIISISVLFLYALITGFSPSVTRAVLMFSILALANLSKRKSNIYNNLALAAFVILVIAPNMLYDLGFQLSFLAVIGIVYFYPLFTRHIEIRNSVFDKMYKLSCVSLGAQILTLPLTLYYFNQFPNYFILSNFIVIPLATIILVLGIAILSFSQLPLLASALAWCLDSSISLLNSGVRLIEDLPMAVARNIHFDRFQMLLLMLFIFLGILSIEYKKRNIIYFLVFLALGFSLYQWKLEMEFSKQKSGLLLSSGHKIYLIEIEGKNLRINSDPDSILNTDFWNYNLSSFALNHGVSSIQKITSNNEHLDDLDYWVVNKDLVVKPKSNKLLNASCQWILIDRENADLDSICTFNPKKGFILADNIPFFIRSKLLLELQNQEVIVHDFKEKGALKLM